jgi:hypothetical protein
MYPARDIQNTKLIQRHYVYFVVCFIDNMAQNDSNNDDDTNQPQEFTSMKAAIFGFVVMQNSGTDPPIILENSQLLRNVTSNWDPNSHDINPV